MGTFKAYMRMLGNKGGYFMRENYKVMRACVAVLMVACFITHIVSVDVYHNYQVGEISIILLAVIFFFIWTPLFLDNHNVRTSDT